MEKVANTIVSYFMSPVKTNKDNPKTVQPVKLQSVSRKDGLVFEAAEIDCVYKCLVEI